MNTLVFTHPEMLWGLPLAALPVLVHLFNRYRVRRRRFGAIDFLVSVKRRTARRLLFRHILLLVVRTMLIVVLVLAASGPVWKLFGGSESIGPVTWVVIIDRSFSMQARSGELTRLALAVNHARQMVLGLREEDRMCLVAAGDSIDVLTEPCTDFPRVLEESLDEIEPGWGRSNLSQAIETAASLLDDGSGSHGRIVLLTDGADHAFWGSVRWPAGMARPEVVIQVVDQEGSRNNLSVDRVQAITRGRYLEVRAQFSSFATKREERLLSQVRADRELLAQGFVDLAAGQSVQKVFNLPKTKFKLQSKEKRPKPVSRYKPKLCEVVLPKDILPEDNRRLFPVPERRPVRILLVNGDMRQVLHQDELFYLEHALSAANEGSSDVLYSSIMPERLDEEQLSGVDVVFLTNVADLPDEATAALRAFGSSGGGLFISMGDRVQVEKTNNLLKDLLPCPLRDVIDLRSVESAGQPEKGMAFTELRLEHPVLSMFEGEAIKSLQMVRTWRAAVVEPELARRMPGVLMRYANDSPALVESSIQGGKVMLFTSTMDRDWTSWPARASFLPFVQRVAFYLAGGHETWLPLEVTVGERVRFQVPEGAQGIKIVEPDGREHRLDVKEMKGQEVSFRHTLRPGWYTVHQDTHQHGQYVGTIPGFLVYPPTQESDLNLIDPERFEKLVGRGSSHTWAGTNRYAGHKPFWVFLFLAIFLVLSEAWLTLREA